MKVKRVIANSRKKAFVIETRKGVFDFPYSRLRVKPSAKDPVVFVESDKELGREGISYSLRSGKNDTIHIDEVLEYHEDPDYIREQLLYRLTLEAQRIQKEKKIPKRELI